MNKMERQVRLAARCATGLNTQHRPKCAGMVDYDKGCSCGASSAINVKLLMPLIIAHLDAKATT